MEMERQMNAEVNSNGGNLIEWEVMEWAEREGISTVDDSFSLEAMDRAPPHSILDQMMLISENPQNPSRSENALRYLIRALAVAGAAPVVQDERPLDSDFFSFSSKSSQSLRAASRLA